MNWHIFHKRKLLFLFVFSTYLLVFFTQISIGRARWMWNFILHPTSTHSAYFWQTLLPQKQEILEKTWWWHHHHIFSGISYFLGIGVCQKYVVWVLVGFRIKFRIQWALLLEIWIKTQGNMSLNFASNELSRLKFE